MNSKNEMLEEYDFSNGIRGKYAQAYKEGEGFKTIIHSQTPIINQKKPLKNQFLDFAGMWKDRDITQESIREQTWR